MKAAPPAGLASFTCVAAAWRLHEAELRAYLRHRLSDDATADDLLQDVFVKAMQQGRGFCALDNPRAWLFQVARNALVDRARTAHPHEPYTDDLAEHTPLDVEPVAPVAALADCLLRTLGELADEDQQILRACDLDGQTQRAFAQAHGLSLPAAKSRLLRARQRLRERLTQACRISFEADGSVCDHAGRSVPEADRCMSGRGSR